jgi:hypothetical protein
VDHRIHPTNRVDLSGDFVRLVKAAEVSDDNAGGLRREILDGIGTVTRAGVQNDLMPLIY